MNSYTVENLPDLNSLLVEVEGPIQIDSFPELYAQILDHPHFKKNCHIIWNALSASITNLTVEDLKRTFYFVKETEARRGNSCSAWVFPEGRNYDTACLFKAAFADGLKIRYGIFSSVENACEWIAGVETRRLGTSTII